MLRGHGFMSEVYTPISSHSGTIALYSTIFVTAPSTTVTYANVQTLDDLRAVPGAFPAVNLTVNATGSGDTIDVTNATIGTTQATRISSSSFATLTFANWHRLTLNALGGADVIHAQQPQRRRELERRHRQRGQ